MDGTNPATLTEVAKASSYFKQTNRGFTDHEHLDDAELIHMNGRAYDYNLGRFLSVDPFIQAPGNSQSMNPYSYIMNNPLSGTDPSGYVAHIDRKGYWYNRTYGGQNAGLKGGNGNGYDPIDRQAERANATVLVATKGEPNAPNIMDATNVVGIKVVSDGFAVSGGTNEIATNVGAQYSNYQETQVPLTKAERKQLSNAIGELQSDLENEISILKSDNIPESVVSVIKANFAGAVSDAKPEDIIKGYEDALSKIRLMSAEHFRKGISKTGALAWVKGSFNTADTTFVYMSKGFVNMLSGANLSDIKATILHEALHLKGYNHYSYDKLIDAGRSGLDLAKSYAKTPVSRHSNLLKEDRRQTLRNPYNYEAYYLDRGY